MTATGCAVFGMKKPPFKTFAGLENPA